MSVALDVSPVVDGGRGDRQARLRAVPDLPAGRASGRRWRLTRRGRAVVLGVLVALLTAAVVGLGAARYGNAAPTPGAERVTVTVGEGDTLWSIAAAAAPQADRRATVDRIVEVNGLDGSRIEPGQRLVVPVDTP
ncbi:MAG: LysM peptidoglycan-binding domain-containing protein [Streptosporangiales bacterium]|nr:LysM peptidoglycan-binding domain-containing protein [Streptosporangiales bacterium]